MCTIFMPLMANKCLDLLRVALVLYSYDALALVGPYCQNDTPSVMFRAKDFESGLSRAMLLIAAPRAQNCIRLNTCGMLGRRS